MKTPNKIAIVGAGGITCHLISLLGLDYNLVFIDGDEFEPKNVSRQFPALANLGGCGRNKAEFLAELTAPNCGHNIEAIPEYLEGGSIVNRAAWDGVDFIFCCVDNNQSRRIVVELCDGEDIPAIVCGNETTMADAHLVIPGYYDPFEHHDFGPETKAPFACTSDDNPAAEQTSHANFLAASCGVHILMSWLAAPKRENLIVHSRLGVRSQSQRTRYRDVSPAKAPADAVAG